VRNIWLTLLLATPLLAELPANARIRRGDDPRWAQPAFDDSAWETVAGRGAPTWGDLAVNRLWVRMRVEIPAGEPSTLVVRTCPCEFYLNGRRLGATGDLNAARPKAGRIVQAFPIPPDVPAGPALLAIREYHPPGFEAFFAIWRNHNVLLVPASRLLFTIESETRNIGLVISVLLLLILTAVCAVLAGERFDQLALLICAYLLCAILGSAFYASRGLNDWFVGMFIGGLFATPQAPLVVLVLASMGRVRLHPIWLTLYLVSHFGLRGWWLLDSLRADPAVWTPAFLVIYPGLTAVAFLLALGILVAAWRRPGAPRVLLLAGTASLLFNFLSRFGIGFGLIGPGVVFAGTIVNWDRIGQITFGLLVASYVIKSAHARRAEEQRLKAELQAAQSVQTLLLGQDLPSGVNAVYLPASEVGGDFYQVFATERGTLVIVGDVSGKGLHAAMTVSAIVGALRNRRSDEPGEVLGELNRVLQGASGFVTCCCVRFEEGEAVIAAAGHPPPYLDGREFSGEGGLPLGLSVDAAYPECRVPAPRVLTLVSDGVVEAENAQRELFGFDRTREISTKSAQEIAEEAKAWGQNDDITVVTVQRIASSEARRNA